MRTTMDSPWTDNQGGGVGRKRAIEELVKGRDLATQLKILLEKPSESDGSVSVEELVDGISRSFTEVISMLNSSAGEECQISDTTLDRRSVDSGEINKRLADKNRRGCYKRRRISESCSNVSPTMEDEYAWRKYGQKDILHANFPRCYFRCTHKNEQGCKATKQVQKVQDEPLMYHTTYFGHHTCTATKRPSQRILTSDHAETSNLVSFESNTPTSEQGNHPFAKAEVKEEAQSNLCEPFEAVIWSDLVAIELFGTGVKLGFDDEDVISSFSRLVESDFNNCFEFDENYHY